MKRKDIAAAIKSESFNDYWELKGMLVSLAIIIGKQPKLML